MSPSMAGKTSIPVKKANQSTAVVSFVWVRGFVFAHKMPQS